MSNNFISKPSPGKRFLSAIYKYKYMYLMLIPTIIFYILFCYVPMYGITIAFREFSYRSPFGGEWVGLKYFEELWLNAEFWKVFKNTIEISLGRLIFEFPVPIVLAILLSEINSSKIKRLSQTVFTFPHFLSWVVGAGIVCTIFADSGAVNQIISYLGFDRVQFLTDANIFRPLLFMTNIWKEAGWSAIIYMATIVSISPELYEAAYIDGANRFRRIWHVTLPGLKGVIGVLLILAVANATNGGFDQVFNMYNALVYETGDIIDTYIYRRTFVLGQSFSSSAALGVFKAVINGTLLVIANFVIKRINNQGLY